MIIKGQVVKHKNIKLVNWSDYSENYDLCISATICCQEKLLENFLERSWKMTDDDIWQYVISKKQESFTVY